MKTFEEWFKKETDTPGRIFYGMDISVVQHNARLGWDAAMAEWETQIQKNNADAYCRHLADIYANLPEPKEVGRFAGVPVMQIPDSMHSHEREKIVLSESNMDVFYKIAMKPYMSVPIKKEDKMCPDCKQCVNLRELTGFPDSRIFCSMSSTMSPKEIERCPWPSKRVKKRTKYQIFCDEMSKHTWFKNALCLPTFCWENILSSLKKAGYEPEEGK